MKIKLTAGFALSFVALLFLMNEVHELVHTIVGRIICGCWGKRDFNVWDLCEGCITQHPSALFATFAGPIFTFIMIWIGTFFLRKNKTASQKSFGFSLVFANMPFARLFQPLTGGGDEVWALSKLMPNHTTASVIGFTVILLITIFPLYKTYQVIGKKGKVLWFILFFLTPVLIDQLVLLGLMNRLLNKRILNDYWILGSPILITVWTFFMLLIFLITRKNIFKLFDKEQEF